MYAVMHGATRRRAVSMAALLRAFFAALLLAGCTHTPGTPGTANPPPGDYLSSGEVTPKDYVTQILEPTGGKIQRPRDWHYTEGHHGPVYMWTLSREDTADGHQPYRTGVRIQVFNLVKQNTGKTPREFMLDFAQSKKDTVKIIRACEPVDQGMFTRMCLETEEGPYHILYSLFWGSDHLDLAVVTISGTTKELWSTYAPVFDRMSEFELIDMKRFEK